MKVSGLFAQVTICSLLFAPAIAGAAEEAAEKNLGQLYDRIATDLASGRPLVATVFVALCDNDTQGIVKVKNRRICRGDDPDQNLYWATAGGLAAVLRAAGWQRMSIDYFGEGDLAVKAIWRKRLVPGGALRTRGIASRFDTYIVGLGYRGSEIREAMSDYLQAVNRDDERPESVADLQLRAGGASHVVGYIGHDYFYDVVDARPLLSLRAGNSVLHKGTFALSCTGHRMIRPAIRRSNAHILMLNRSLGLPGAWTAEAIVTAIADGQDAQAIHRYAAAAFAKGQRIPLPSALGAFAFGD